METGPATTIAGVVLEGDAPVRGARVMLFPDGEQRPKQVIRAGDRGLFSFAVEADTSYRIRVRHRERGRRDLEREGIRAGARLTLRFEPLVTREVRIRALAPDGEAVRSLKAMVHEVRHGRRRIAFHRGSMQGDVLIAQLPADVQRVGVWAQAYRPAWFPIEPRPPGGVYVVHLVSAPSIRGVVTYNGRRVAGARVHAHQTLRPGSFAYQGTSVMTVLDRIFSNTLTTTDDDGQFAVPIPGAGVYVVHASTEGASGGSEPVPVANDASPTDTHDIVLHEKTGVIHGLVSLPAGVDPASMLVVASCGDSHVVTSDVASNGVYRLAGLAPGSWQVAAIARDLAVAFSANKIGPCRDPKRQRPVDVQLAEGQTVVYDLDLTATHAAVRVELFLSFGGAPVRGWTAAVRRGDDLVIGTADGSGRVVLEARGAGKALVAITCRRDGCVLRGLVDAVFAERPSPIVLRIPTGSVLLQKLPVRKQAERTLIPMEPGDDASEFALIWSKGDGVRWSARFVRGDDGKVLLRDLPVGAVSIRRRESRERQPDNWPEIGRIEIKRGRTAEYVYGGGR